MSFKADDDKAASADAAGRAGDTGRGNACGSQDDDHIDDHADKANGNAPSGGGNDSGGDCRDDDQNADDGLYLFPDDPCYNN